MKLNHVQDMLLNCVYQKCLKIRAVLMDTWYATKKIMLQIEKFNQIDYCPLKVNRQVDDSGGSKLCQRIDNRSWTPAEQQHGKVIKIKGFPAEHKVDVFRVVYPAHGLSRDQRHSARQPRGCTTNVPLPLES